MASAAGARRSETLKKRRLEAAQLFGGGATQAEVARRLGVSRVSAMRWYRLWRKGGRGRLGQTPPLGRPSRLDPTQLKRIGQVLLKVGLPRFRGRVSACESRLGVAPLKPNG
jgi:transposase